jgi:hypothetical protein
MIQNHTGRHDGARVTDEEIKARLAARQPSPH